MTTIKLISHRYEIIQSIRTVTTRNTIFVVDDHVIFSELSDCNHNASYVFGNNAHNKYLWNMILMISELDTQNATYNYDSIEVIIEEFKKKQFINIIDPLHKYIPNLSNAQILENIEALCKMNNIAIPYVAEAEQMMHNLKINNKNNIIILNLHERYSLLMKLILKNQLISKA